MRKRDLNRREFGAAVGVGVAALAAGCTASSEGSRDVPRDAAADDAPEGPATPVVIDALASPGPFNVMNRIGQPLSAEMLDNVRRSGISAVNVTVSGGGSGDDAFHDTMRYLAYFEREVTEHPDVFARVRTAADIETAAATGRLGLILGFQDTTMFGSELERADLFHDMGVRVVQLTYNVRNLVGDGCLQAENGGLSDFGREVVNRLNELGVVIDLSHCGQATTAEAIALSTAPVGITHTGCRTVFEHPRSKRDEELRSMAEKGGVVGIYMMPFLNAEGPAQASHFYDHIEHAVDICGEDHVGVGSDNSITPTVADDAYIAGLTAFADERQRLGIGAPREHEVLFVEGLNRADRSARIAEGLADRGHTPARIDKILGGNFQRLFEEVWAG